MAEVAIIGLGRFGRALAVSLMEMGNEVLGVDSDIDIVDEMQDQLTSAVCMDVRDEKALKTLNLEDFDTVVVGIGDDTESSIIVSMIAKDFGVRRLICKAQNGIHARILERIGVDRVIFPERDAGLRLAHGISNRRVMEAMQLDEDVSMLEIQPLDGWIDKTLAELSFAARHKITVVAIKRGDALLTPQGNERILSGDVLIVSGSNAALRKLDQNQ